MSDPMPGLTDFIVRLDGLKIDDAVRQRVAAAISSAVLNELAHLDLNRNGTLAIHTPREWLGRWLREVNNIRQLEGIDQTLRVDVR